MKGPKPQKAAPGTSISAQAVSMQKSGAKQVEQKKTMTKLGSMFGFGKKKQEEIMTVTDEPMTIGDESIPVPVAAERSRNASVMPPVSIIRASEQSIKQIEKDMKSIYVFFHEKCDEVSIICYNVKLCYLLEVL